MDRLINYVFLFCVIYLFVLESGAGERYQLGIALVAGLMFAILAFLLKWLTLDGAVAALVFGCVTLGFGGWQAAALIFTFFLTSILLSQDSVIVIEETEQVFSEKERRNGIQVWANGFWFALFILLGYVFGSELLWIGAAGSMATATADTWATELGSKRFQKPTYLINNFQKVVAGTDGGISLPGTLAATAGSFLIAVVTVICYPVSWGAGLFSIFLSGFSGCMVDSYLGAILQRQKKAISFEFGNPLAGFSADNNLVNWAATGSGSVAAVIIYLMLS